MQNIYNAFMSFSLSLYADHVYRQIVCETMQNSYGIEGLC